MVTAGNWPWWLTTSGAMPRSKRATVDSGICVPPLPADVDVRQVVRIALVLRIDLQDHAVLVALGVDGRDLALRDTRC